MGDFGSFVEGILNRALEYSIHDIFPGLVGLLPGPFGTLLKVALTTDWAKNLEQSLAAKAETLASNELAKIENDCKAWAGDFLKKHPAAQEFWNAVKPETLPTFVLKTDELYAVLAAQKDHTFRNRMGLAA